METNKILRTSDEQRPFWKLSNDSISFVLSFVRTVDLLSLACVSKSAHNYIYYSFKWRELDIAIGMTLTQFTLISLLQKIGNQLQSFKLSRMHRYDISKVLSALVTCASNLKHLELRHAHVSDSQLEEVYNNFPKLETLILDLAPPEGFFSNNDEILKCVGSHVNLKTLIVPPFSMLHESSESIWPKGLRHFQFVYSYDIHQPYDNNVIPIGLDTFVVPSYWTFNDVKPALVNLTHLDIDLHLEDYDVIEEILSKNPTLQSLIITYGTLDITHPTLRKLKILEVESLTIRAPQLEHLWINNKIRSQDSLVTDCPKLKTVIVDEVPWNHDSVVNIDSKHITRLEVSVSDKNFAILEHFQNLEILKLEAHPSLKLPSLENFPKLRYFAYSFPWNVEDPENNGTITLQSSSLENLSMQFQTYGVEITHITLMCPHLKTLSLDGDVGKLQGETPSLEMAYIRCFKVPTPLTDLCQIAPSLRLLELYEVKIRSGTTGSFPKLVSLIITELKIIDCISVRCPMLKYLYFDGISPELEEWIQTLSSLEIVHTRSLCAASMFKPLVNLKRLDIGHKLYPDLLLSLPHLTHLHVPLSMDAIEIIGKYAPPLLHLEFYVLYAPGVNEQEQILSLEQPIMDLLRKLKGLISLTIQNEDLPSIREAANSLGIRFHSIRPCNLYPSFSVEETPFPADNCYRSHTFRDVLFQKWC